MGLGKTITTIALIASLFTTYWKKIAEKKAKAEIGPFLIVCPATCIS
jgi:SNF2 family DNA or RNA helicase